MLSTLLLATAVSALAEPADPEPDAVAVIAPVEAEVPTHAILSFYPGATLSGAAAIAVAVVPIWLPVGVQVPLSASISLDVDLSVLAALTAGSPGWAFTASAGPTWFPRADGTSSGFFIGPRLQFITGVAALVASPPSGDGGPLDGGPSLRRSFLVGFDLGWQFRRGRLVFGPIVGASAGYSYDSTSVFATPLEGARPRIPIARTGTFAFGLNLTLFRLGVAL